MNEILKIVLSLSLSGSLLILVLLLCKPLFRNRISKRWQYYIWLVVIARLLLPFTPETSPVSTLFQQIDRVIVQADTTPIPRQNMALILGDNTVIKNETAPKSGETDAAPIPQRFFSGVIQNLWLAWLMVALILIIRKITIYQGFVKYIRAGRAEVSDTAILDRLALSGEQAGIKRPVELYTNSLISSPLLLGFFRPCIVLPSTDLTPIDLENTLLHELTHYKHRDMFYKWLVQLVICLHWFNPFVYLMGREVGRACELACDEAVIMALDPQGRRAYGDTLLNAIGAGGNYKDTLASITLNENKQLLKERLGAIMVYRKKTKLIFAISLVLTITLACGATAIGAYAADPSASLKGEEVTPDPPNVMVPTKTANTKQEAAPLHIDNSKIAFEDNQYHWPYNVIRLTNTSDKAIIDYEIVCLAYDKDGNPLELYWDAQNVATDGEIGSVGFGTDGVDYGIVTGISPVSPKAYSHIYRKMRQLPPEDLIRSLEKANGKAWVENWLQEWKKSEKELTRENSVAPGQSQQISWPLFDGWNQSMGTHDVTYLVAFIKQVTYDDGDVWVNPAYGMWVNEYQGKSVSTGILEDYYD
ncbi:M56 family metallopeptidase [Hungatella sp. SB206]|uniref:M56 family metallopeptidase n=1 Tax=Hungatella sp. SB206 TaxID=2937758 RepID=UPI003DA98210